MKVTLRKSHNSEQNDDKIIIKKMLFLSFLLISKVFHKCDNDIIDVGEIYEEIDYVIDCKADIKLMLTDHAYIRSIIVPEGPISIDMTFRTDYFGTKLIFSHGNYIKFKNNCTIFSAEIHGQPTLTYNNRTAIKIINLYTNNNININHVNKYELLPLTTEIKLMSEPETIRICLSDDEDFCDNSTYLTNYNFTDAPLNSSVEIITSFAKYTNINLTFPDYFINSLNITADQYTEFDIYVLKTNFANFSQGTYQTFGNIIITEFRPNNCDVAAHKDSKFQCCNLYTSKTTFYTKIYIIRAKSLNYIVGTDKSIDKVAFIATSNSLYVKMITADKYSENHGKVNFYNVTVISPFYCYGSAEGYSNDIDIDIHYRYEGPLIKCEFYNVNIIMNTTEAIYCSELFLFSSTIDYRYNIVEFDFYSSFKVTRGNHQKIYLKQKNYVSPTVVDIIIMTDFTVSNLTICGDVTVKGTLRANSIISECDACSLTVSKLTTNSNLILSSITIKVENAISGNDITIKRSNITSDTIVAESSINISDCLEFYITGSISCSDITANTSNINCPSITSTNFEILDCELISNRISGNILIFNNSRTTSSIEINMKNLKIYSSTFSYVEVTWDKQSIIDIFADLMTTLHLTKAIQCKDMTANNITFTNSQALTINISNLYVTNTIFENIYFSIVDNQFFQPNYEIINADSSSKVTIYTDYISLEYIKIENVKIVSKHENIVKNLKIINSDVSEAVFSFVGISYCKVNNSRSDEPVYISNFDCMFFEINSSLSTKLENVKIKAESLEFFSVVKIDPKIELLPYGDFLLECTDFMTVNITQSSYLSLTVVNAIARGVTEINPSIKMLNLKENGHVENMVFKFGQVTRIYGNISETIYTNGIDCIRLDLFDTNLEARTSMMGVVNIGLYLTNSTLTNIYFNFTNPHSGPALTISADKPTEIECNLIKNTELNPEVYMTNITLNLVNNPDVTILKLLLLKNSKINGDIKLKAIDDNMTVISDDVADVYIIGCVAKDLFLTNINLKSNNNLIIDISTMTLNESTIDNIDLNLVGEENIIRSNNIINPDIFVNSITGGAVTLYDVNLQARTSGTSMIISKLQLFNSTTNDVLFDCVNDVISMSADEIETVKVKQISAKTSGSFVDLTLENIKLVGANAVTATARLVKIIESSVENIKFNLVDDAEIVATKKSTEIEVTGIDCKSLSLESVDIISSTIVVANVENISLKDSKVSNMISFSVVSQWTANIVSNIAQGSTIYFNKIEALGLYMKSIIMESNEVIYADLHNLLRLEHGAFSEKIKFNFTERPFMPGQVMHEVHIESQTKQPLQVVGIICDKLTLADVDMTGYSTDSINDYLTIYISTIRCVSSTISKIEIALENSAFINSALLESSEPQALYFQRIDVTEINMKNIIMETTSSLLNAIVERKLTLQSSSISQSIVFNFTYHPDRYYNITQIQSDNPADISVTNIYCRDLVLKNISLHGITNDDYLIINISGLSLLNSAMNKIKIDLKSTTDESNMNSNSLIDVLVERIDAINLLVQKINFIGGKAKLSNIKFINSKAETMEFDICDYKGYVSGIESNNRIKINVNSIVTQEIYINNIEVVTKEPVEIRCRELELKNTILPETMSVTFEYSPRNWVLRVRSSEPRSLVFNNISTTGGIEHKDVPVILYLTNIESIGDEVIDVYIESLFIQSSTINNMMIYVTGKDALIRGSGETINIMEIETNGIDFKEIKINHLGSRNYTLKHQTEGKILLRNVDLNRANAINFNIIAPNFTIDADYQIIDIKILEVDYLTLINVTLTGPVMVKNCALNLTNVKTYIYFNYNEVNTVILDGKGNSTIYTMEIQNIGNLIIQDIVLVTPKITILTQNLDLKGNVSLGEADFSFNRAAGGLSGPCNIRGEGHTITMSESMNGPFHFYNINIKGYYLHGKEIIMEKTRMTLKMIVTYNSDSFKIVDKSRYNQTYNLTCIKISSINTMLVDAVHLVIDTPVTLGHINLLNGGTVTGDGAMADNFEIGFENLGKLDSLVSSQKYTVILVDKMMVSTTSNEAILESLNIVFKMSLDHDKFSKLFFIPKNNPLELKNISTFDEMIGPNMEKILKRIDFEGNVNKFIFDGFEKLIPDLNFNINISSVTIIKGTNPIVIGFTKNPTIESSSSGTISFSEVNFYDCETVRAKGNIEINKCNMFVKNSLSFAGSSSKISFGQISLTTFDANGQRSLASSIPIEVSSLELSPCSGNNTRFGDNIVINSLYFQFLKAKSMCFIPSLYGTGIRTDNVNVMHDRNFSGKTEELISDQYCIWDFKGRDDSLKNVYANLIPEEAGGKKIKISCVDDYAYLYLPNGETAQQAVWISKKQFTVILISGFIVIGIMLISFFVISIFRYKKLDSSACQMSDIRED